MVTVQDLPPEIQTLRGYEAQMLGLLENFTGAYLAGAHRGGQQGLGSSCQSENKASSVLCNACAQHSQSSAFTAFCATPSPTQRHGG